MKKLSAKRRKLDERNTAENTLWQQCHSGFDDEIILSEQLGLNTRSSKGRKKDDIKLLEISRKDGKYGKLVKVLIIIQCSSYKIKENMSRYWTL